MTRGEGSNRERSERIDKKHRFTLRIDPDLHNEIDAESFRLRLSDNLVYVEAIAWAINHPDFRSALESKYGRRTDPRRGHFVYLPSRRG
jgi:hypothetical protein